MLFCHYIYHDTLFPDQMKDVFRFYKKTSPYPTIVVYRSSYRKQAIFLAVFGLSFCFGDVGHVSELFHFLDTSFEAGYEPGGIK